MLFSISTVHHVLRESSPGDNHVEFPHGILPSSMVRGLDETGSILNDDFLYEYYSEVRSVTKEITIITASSASISFIASAFISGWIIFRSRDGLSTTFHRLLLGLCISDIISSMMSIMELWIYPKDTDYASWNAVGNLASCEAKAFLLSYSSYCAVLYNCSICFYYLAIIKYNKTDEYIKTRLEPFLHGVPISIPLIRASVILASKTYNAPYCSLPVEYNPPHCYGYEDGEVPDGYDIPCGRGNAHTAKVLNYMTIMAYSVPPFIMIITMMMMYCAVRKIEKKMDEYGVTALRNRGSVGQDNMQDNQNNDKWCLPRFWQKIKMKFVPNNSSNSDKSRTILHKALAYTTAYFVAWTPWLIILWINVIFGKEAHLFWWYTSSLLHPLQGLFNFLVFLYPKVTSFKKSYGEEISWCGAFGKALISRGGARRPNKRNNKKLRTTSKTTNSRKTSYMASMAHSSNEEGKCEAQAQLNPQFSGPVGTRGGHFATTFDGSKRGSKPSDDKLMKVIEKILDVDADNDGNKGIANEPAIITMKSETLYTQEESRDRGMIGDEEENRLEKEGCDQLEGEDAIDSGKELDELNDESVQNGTILNTKQGLDEEVGRNDENGSDKLARIGEVEGEDKKVPVRVGEEGAPGLIQRVVKD